MKSAPPPAEPTESYDTEWTPGALRLHVDVWPAAIHLRVESRVANVATGTWTTFILGQVSVPGYNIQATSLAFVRNALGFFQDQRLVGLGAEALAKVFAPLTQDASGGGLPPPPSSLN